MKYLLALVLIGSVLVGCSGSAGDVDVNSVQNKEKQIDEASKKLNGADAERPRE